MNADLASLHKILKDETRRKILLELNKTGSLTYTELLAAVNISKTGTLNYHLKILGDLLSKTASGQYLLSEKGKAAAKLMLEFPEPDYSIQEKKLWWKRFWVAAVTIDAVSIVLIIFFNIIGYIDVFITTRALFGSVTGLVALYFFYRIVKPKSKKAAAPQSQTQVERHRTTADIFVSGRSLKEVTAKIQEWINLEGITIEAQREGYLRGRLGIPSGLGLTAPKYFEVLCTPKDGGINVHTEGWISVYDIREESFSSNLLVMANIPRRKGQ
jgi:DNA-binding transcriptional ArsR family regulator